MKIGIALALGLVVVCGLILCAVHARTGGVPLALILAWTPLVAAVPIVVILAAPFAPKRARLITAVFVGYALLIALSLGLPFALLFWLALK